MTAYLAFSGGKDSTACAYRLADLGEDFSLLFTATGNELPDLQEHIASVVRDTGKELITPPNRGLAEWIAHFGALPSHRMRWCTRLIKIEPCIAFLTQHPGSTLMVGLRADEESRVGLYGEHATYRYPLREWGWGLADVRRYLRERGITVPRRTDCAVCPYQRIGEWWRLWKSWPEHWAEGERWEAETGHTFRAPGRDSWPAPLVQLRKRFEAGAEPLDVVKDRQLSWLEQEQVCRVCSL